MRIVNRRYLAALLALWLVLAVGLAAQADPSQVTMTIECPETGCVVGGSAHVSGDGLRLRDDELELFRYWLAMDFDGPHGNVGYQRAIVNSDGTYFVNVRWSEAAGAGVHELCLTYQKGASVRILVCETVEVLP